MIKPKKSLGQNFLIDKNIVAKILDTTIIENKSILEIGPGKGSLTSSILKKNPKKLYVIEKDDNLSKLLSTQFNDKLTILNKDVLKIDEKKLSKEKLIVFGNLPYNISTEILSKWILSLDKNNFWFESLSLMFQKEVADRIIAKFNTSNYGRLTVLANWKLDVTKICDINPTSFSPRPKIQSTLLFFRPKKMFINFKDPKNLENITRVFFNHRRKMIKKPFNQMFDGNEEILKKLNLNLNLRPQNLDTDTYYKLTQFYEYLRS